MIDFTNIFNKWVHLKYTIKDTEDDCVQLDRLLKELHNQCLITYTMYICYFHMLNEIKYQYIHSYIDINYI